MDLAGKHLYTSINLSDSLTAQRLPGLSLELLCAFPSCLWPVVTTNIQLTNRSAA